MHILAKAHSEKLGGGYIIRWTLITVFLITSLQLHYNLFSSLPMPPTSWWFILPLKLYFFMWLPTTIFFHTVELKWGSWNIMIIAQNGVWGCMFFVLPMYRKPFFNNFNQVLLYISICCGRFGSRCQWLQRFNTAHVEQHPQLQQPSLNTDLKLLRWDTNAVCFDQIS